MAKLSKRERVLIYIAFIMVILCFGYYLLLLPSKAVYTEAKASYSNALAREHNKDILFQAEDSLYGAFEIGKKYYLSHQADLSAKVDTVRLEQKVLSYLNQYGLEPVSTRAKENQAVDEKKFLIKTSIIVSCLGTWDHIFAMLDELEQEEGIHISSFQLNTASDSGLYNIEFTVDFYMSEEQTVSWEDIS